MTNKYTEAEMQEMLNERHSRAFTAWVDREHELALEEDRSRAAAALAQREHLRALETARDLQAVRQKLNDEMAAAARRRADEAHRAEKLALDLQEAQVALARARAALDHAQATARRLGAQNAVLKGMIAAVAKVEP